MSQSQTVSLYHRKLRETQGINHALYGHFSSDTAQEFIIVRGSLLELISLDPSTQNFTTVCQHDTSSHIRDIKTFLFDDHGRNYIAVVCDSGVLTVLRFNRVLGDFEAIVSEMYGRSGVRRAVAGEYIACDPLGRSIMIGGLENAKIVYGTGSELKPNPADINAPATRIYNVTSGVQLNSSDTVTYDIAALHTERYTNPCFVAIESNYNEVLAANIVNKKNPNSAQNTVKVNLVNTTNKYDPVNRCKYLTVYEHEVNMGNLNKLTKIASIPIPSSAHKIIPIPLTHIYPGGCIVLCENTCYYYPVISPQQLHNLAHSNENAMVGGTSASSSAFHETFVPLSGIRCDYPIRLTNQQNANAQRETMINSATTFLLQTKKNHKFFIFVQSEHGDLFKIDLSTILHRAEHKAIVKNIQQQIQYQQQQLLEAQGGANANLHTLSIPNELATAGITNTITEIRCEYFDTLPPTQSIHLTNKGQLFVIGEMTDSALFKIKSPEIDRNDPSYAMATSLIYHDAPDGTSDLQTLEVIQQQLAQSKVTFEPHPFDNTHPYSLETILSNTHHDISSQMSFIPTPLLRLQYQITLPTLSTLRSATISSTNTATTAPDNDVNGNTSAISADSTNTLSIYTAHGSSSRSYLTVNKFGLLYNVLAHSALGNTPTKLFRAITNCFTPQHSLLCVAFPTSTLLMSTNESLQDFSHQSLTFDQTTIAFGNVIDHNNSNSQSDIGLIYNAENTIYLNRSALIQVTPKQVNCLTNGNTGPINMDTDEAYQQSLSYIANSSTKWDAGLHDITCADITYHYIVIGSSSKLHVLKLSFNALAEVCSLDCGAVISQITCYKEPFEQASRSQGGKLFFSTVGVDGFLRFYSLVHDRGSFSLQETDIQHIGSTNPSLLITATTVEGGNKTGATNNFYYSCHIIIKNMLYQYTLSPEGQIITTEPLKQYIGGNQSSHTKLCLVENIPNSTSNTTASTTPDIILCSTNRTPQVFHNNNWLQLNIVNPTSSEEENKDGYINDLITLKQTQAIDPAVTNHKAQPRNINNLGCNQHYGVIYNAIYLDTPVGELIIANCDSELLICQSAPAGTAAISLNPSRFIRPQVDQEEPTVPTYFNTNNNYLTTTAVQALTYTCRNLVHFDVKELCGQYRITHTPLATAITQPTTSSTTMGDEPGDTKPLLPYEAPLDIIDNGVCKLAKQLGGVLISIEGDNQVMLGRENTTFYSTCLEQQYLSLTHSQADLVTDYTIKHPLESNTAKLSGGNTLEYFNGYPIGTEYNGCVRLMDPNSLQTFHAISTPQNMIITCSTLAVMSDYTILVVGGYRSRPLDYDIAVKTGGQNLHSDQTAAGQAQKCVTTGLLVTYELYYSPKSRSWAISHLHTTHTPHRVSAINKIHYNQSLLVGQSDELCVYELGKKQLLFKSKIPLRRGLISTITPTAQFNVLDHTNAINTIIYVGFAGQGYSMVRLSINKPVSETALITQSSSASPQQIQPISTRYIWNLLCNNVDSRYSLSATPVQGGIISGDRFGNLSFYGLNNEDIITLIKDPTGYAAGMTTAPSVAASVLSGNGTTYGNYFYNELGVRMQNLAEVYLGAPITNIFTVNLPNFSATATPANTGSEIPQTQQCVLYTTLSGQIGILKPITSPFENEILQKCLSHCYNQLTITGSLVRKYLSTWNPVLNVVDGGVLTKWLQKLLALHYTLAGSNPALPKSQQQFDDNDDPGNKSVNSNQQIKNVYNYNPNYSADQHYRHLLSIANDYCGAGDATINPNVLLDLIQLIKFIDNNALR